MKKILLFGGFGFIGTNLLKFIDEYYHDEYVVVVFDRFLKHPHGLSFKCIQKVYAGDFADSLLIREIFQQDKFDYVFHFLSSTVPSTSFNTSFDVESNVIPTLRMLDLMIEFNVKNIVYLSSGGAIYGNSENHIKHKESDNAFPLSSYGVVKLTIEKYLCQYQYTNKINPLILRLSNPYGKYHYSMKQGIINIALKSAIQGEIVKVWGDGNTKKDYIFIDDFCDILLKLISRKVTNQILNIGSCQILSLNDILLAIKKRWNTLTWIYTNASKNDVSNFELDISNLNKNIGEYTFTTFEEGLSKTTNWLIDK